MVVSCRLVDLRKRSESGSGFLLVFWDSCRRRQHAAKFACVYNWEV